MSAVQGWRCKKCTLDNRSGARRCAACDHPRGRTRNRAAPEVSISLQEDRAYASTEEIVVKFINPNQNSFDVVSIVPSTTTSDDHWPVPGVTEEHWKYIGTDSNKWNGCLRKEPVEGSVKFDADIFEPGTYEVQLRYFRNGSWSNVQKRARLDVAETIAKARLLPPPSAHLVRSKKTLNGFPPKKMHRALVGLQNIGNTCYMNAAVQCLATLTPLMDEFLARDPGPEPPSSGRSYFSLDRKRSSDLDVPLESPKARTVKIKKEPQIPLSEGEWRCTACTLTNKQGDIHCKLCGKLAGREVREQVRKQDSENLPTLQLSKNKYGEDDDILIKFTDPLARPYTVICIVPKSVPEYGDGIWPIPGWDTQGASWNYTKANTDSGVTGAFDGEVKFSAKRIGGGQFQAQIRYYQGGSWSKVETHASVFVKGSPLKPKKRWKASPGGGEGGTTSFSTPPPSGSIGAKNLESTANSAAKPEDVKGKGEKTPNHVRVGEKILASSFTVKPTPKPLKPGVLSGEFTRLVHILSNNEIEDKYICPEYLKALIEHVRPEFKGNEQHDCQEFTQALLDELNCDLKRIEKKPKAKRKRRARTTVIQKSKRRKVQKAQEEQHHTPTKRANAIWETLRRPNGSVISEMFFGMTQNRVECQTCFKRSTVYSTFSTVSLNIPLRNRHSSAKSLPARSGGGRRSLRSAYSIHDSSSSSNGHSISSAGSSGGKRKKKVFGSQSSRRHHRRTTTTIGSGQENSRGGNEIPQVDGNGYHSSMDPGDETKTLHQCFQDFTKEERLSGSNAYFCSRCNKRGDATCRMMFYHLPPVLIIHLKRFAADGSGKADSQIAFPNELDLSHYCLRSAENLVSKYKNSHRQNRSGGKMNGKSKSEEAKKAAEEQDDEEAAVAGMQDCRYRLVGVVNHQQNDGYKHYTALTLAKLDGSSGESSSKGPQLDNLKKRSRVNEAGQPFFGRVYQSDHAGWVEFDDEKAWRLSTHEARSERARLRTRREAYLLFYEAVRS
mmetsp:Transcript_14540/g.20404  ORF Transcript_14540/g.20404 Transcript_14540/m.20404 type:complete len:1005 (+) Transcript_14540:63-3077(+)